jgi:hypothetical protein
MADNLTTFLCRLSRNLGASTFWNPKGLSRSVMGLLYLFLYTTIRGKIPVSRQTSHSMEQDHSGTNISSVSQDIPRILWNQDLYHRIHKGPPLVPILSHMNQFHLLLSQFIKIYFNMNPLLNPRLTSELLHSVLPTTTLCAFLFASICAT